MMPFRFQLEGLLHVRRLIERQARDRLDESMMHIRGLEHRLDDAVRWSRETAGARSANTVFPAAELQFIESVLRQTQEAITRCQREKEVEERRAVELRANYLLARRERKTVGTLRKNALHQFQTEETRREQSQLDEIFLGKLVRSRNDGRQAYGQGLAETLPESNP